MLVDTLDSDGDGVKDKDDACPNTPVGEVVDEHGCPSVVIEPDDDRDGIANHLDQCPASKVDAKVDNAGCELAEVIILRGVNFETDSSQLKPESQLVLNEMAGILRKYPEMLVEVAGHTDARGPDAYNMDLSKRRAQAVMEYLLSQGVVRSALVAKGYGESLPISDNLTPVGWAANRRVELHILQR